ncbi:MAG TPA: hypothetical protein VFG53_01030 [Anaeromyxobacter sp.]|nr:hypothetical protein [Anaeromyxobacter sp.]
MTISQPTEPATRSAWGPRWEHGRVHYDDEGGPTYFIEVRRVGNYYLRKTDVHTEREALAEFALFETNPPAYLPRGERQAAAAKPAEERAGPPPILLDDKLATEFIDYSREVLKLAPDWLRKKRAYLAWWTEKLWGVDLRRISLRLVLSKVPKGERTTARAHKIAVLRSLGEYLTDPDQRMSYRENEPTLEPEENTLHALRVPQTEPAQSQGKKRPVSVDQLKLVMENLTGQVNRDVVTVLLATGWHASELRYFATEGEIQPAPAEYRRTGTAAILVTLHKKGKTRRWKPRRVAEAAQAAAERLQAHGGFDLARVDKALRAACAAAKITPFGLGQIRHVVASYAKAAGATDAQRAAFLFHDARTDNRNYAQLQSVERIPTPLDELA